MALGLIIGIVVAVLSVGFIILLYNSLIRLKNQVKNSWGQIDVQLKRRNDLIPNLVNTVKGYMKHEKTTLENITKARSAIMAAEGNVEKTAEASNMLSDTLKSLFAVTENYPDLKANQSFLQLQEEITGTENKIAYSRQHYNDVVMIFNTKIQTFPNNVFANMLKFTEEKQFEATEAERKNVEVKF
ncbi:LemA family protein [Candidatus Woesearchaeota archaeon]|jgi:LemA protein|nr:LemA family protein [Candidatus Woesearchaeota archaeon]